MDNIAQKPRTICVHLSVFAQRDYDIGQWALKKSVRCRSWKLQRELPTASTQSVRDQSANTNANMQRFGLLSILYHQIQAFVQYLGTCAFAVVEYCANRDHHRF